MHYVDLPLLNTLQLGERAINGDSRSERQTILDEPFNYSNTLTMKSGDRLSG